MPTHLCPICKKTKLSTKHAKRCRKCWYTRTGVQSLAKHKTCVDCGTPIGSHSTRCRVCYYKEQGKRGKVASRAFREGQQSIHQPLASYEAAVRQWDRCIGRMKKRQQSIPKKPVGRERIVICPDVHAPYHEPDMLARICAEGSRASKVICVGDISDSYAFSVYSQYETMSFSEEWASVTQVIDALSSSFNSVEIVIGNHDQRLEKRLLDRLSRDMVDAVKYMTGGILCPLTALAKQYENVSIARHETPTGQSIDWFTTIGDVWIGHPQQFSTTPGTALRKVDDWLSHAAQSLGLDRYKLIIMGHTHQLSMFPWRGDQLLVECGCICQLQSYQYQTGKIGGRPQKRGYVWFELDDGTVDLNTFGWHWFDVEKT